MSEKQVQNIAQDDAVLDVKDLRRAMQPTWNTAGVTKFFDEVTAERKKFENDPAQFQEYLKRLNHEAHEQNLLLPNVEIADISKGFGLISEPNIVFKERRAGLESTDLEKDLAIMGLAPGDLRNRLLDQKEFSKSDLSLQLKEDAKKASHALLHKDGFAALDIATRVKEELRDKPKLFKVWSDEVNMAANASGSLSKPVIERKQYTVDDLTPHLREEMEKELVVWRERKSHRWPWYDQDKAQDKFVRESWELHQRVREELKDRPNLENVYDKEFDRIAEEERLYHKVYTDGTLMDFVSKFIP